MSDLRTFNPTTTLLQLDFETIIYENKHRYVLAELTRY